MTSGPAEPLQSKQECQHLRSLHAFQRENTQACENPLEAITQSTITNIHRAAQIGASGALLSIFNATSKFGSVDEYER
jgi:hypothetical protein